MIIHSSILNKCMSELRELFLLSTRECRLFRSVFSCASEMEKQLNFLKSVSNSPDLFLLPGSLINKLHVM